MIGAMISADIEEKKGDSKSDRMVRGIPQGEEGAAGVVFARIARRGVYVCVCVRGMEGGGGHIRALG